MNWKTFAWNAKQKSKIACRRDFLGYQRDAVHTWLANYWIRQNRKNAFGTIMEVFKGAQKDTEDWKNAYWALVYIVAGDFERPDDYSDTRVALAAAESGKFYELLSWSHSFKREIRFEEMLRTYTSNR